MLELMMGGGSDYVVKIPPADSKTLFRMADFNTAADVKDKGPNAIGVTPSALTVGADDFASYMYFNGSGYFGIASNALLARTDIEIRFIIGQAEFVGGQYGPAIFDTRPINNNGDLQYLIFGLAAGTTDPVGFNLNFPSTTYITSEPVYLNRGPVMLVIRIDATGTYLFINNRQKIKLTASGPLRTNNLKVGLPAFKSAGVPNYKGRMYYMDIRSLT